MQEFTSGQMKYAFGLFLLFCASIFMSCEELNYWMSGRTTAATIVDRQLVTVRGRRFSEKEQLRIGYKFTDAEGLKREGYWLRDPDDCGIPTEPKVEIEYLRGQFGRSRIAGDRQWTWPILMLGIPLGVAAWCWVYVRRETSRPLTGKRAQ